MAGQGIAEPPHLQVTVTGGSDGVARVQQEYLMDDPEIDAQTDAVSERYAACRGGYANRGW